MRSSEINGRDLCPGTAVLLAISKCLEHHGICGEACHGGPVKHERANRGIRGLLNGKWPVDTLNAEYVWEHEYCEFITRRRK